MSVPEFCTSRIEDLTEQYLKGEGFGEIYECCVLTYLEVSVAARGFDPDKMWDGWLAILQERTGNVAPLARHLGDSPEGRAELVEALKQFRRRFALPRTRPPGFSLPDSQVDVVESVEPQPPEDTGEPLDLFDFLNGDQS
jgi:hypothetical protein